MVIYLPQDMDSHRVPIPRRGKPRTLTSRPTGTLKPPHLQNTTGELRRCGINGGEIKQLAKFRYLHQPDIRLTSGDLGMISSIICDIAVTSTKENQPDP